MLPAIGPETFFAPPRISPFEPDLGSAGRMDEQDLDGGNAAEDGLRLMRLFVQLKTKANREEAIRWMEAFVNSVAAEGD
jgi:hypothetical protein